MTKKPQTCRLGLGLNTQPQVWQVECLPYIPPAISGANPSAGGVDKDIYLMLLSSRFVKSPVLT